MNPAYFNRDGGTWVGIPLWVADVLETKDIAVYVFAAAHADNETGEFFASNKTIALEMGRHRETVAKSMRRMEALGIIESKPRRRADGYKSSNQRRFRLEAPADWIDPRDRVRSEREGAQKWANSEGLDSHTTVEGAVESLCEVQSQDCNLTRPNDVDSIDVKKKLDSFSETDTHTNQPTNKRTAIGVSGPTEREAAEFIERFRQIDPTLGGELPDHITAVYADQCNRRGLEHRQIMAQLERYAWRKDDEYFEYGDQHFKSPTTFLRYEVMPGVDYTYGDDTEATTPLALVADPMEVAA
jgi:hypothetical protein